MDRIDIAITMDCEPITSLTHASATGPDTWALGERAVRGIAAITRDFGFGITYFIHPEPALAQPALFKEMEAEGACIGLHMHPWKYSLSRHGGRRYLEHYGGLAEDEQRDLVSEASALWSEAIGRWPLYFRPGTFSANDAVFKVLAELGFRGGSCSLPGRQMPEMRANWTGTVPDPHRGHARFRQLEGALDFAEMPLSTDFSIALSGRIGGKLHPDLRPDIDWLAQYDLTYDTIATNIVAQIVERAPAVPVINLVTHNHFDFSDPRHPATVRLTQALAAIRDACARAGVKAAPATMHDVAEAVLARPPVAQDFVCEGAVYGKSGGVGTLAPKVAA